MSMKCGGIRRWDDHHITPKCAVSSTTPTSPYIAMKQDHTMIMKSCTNYIHYMYKFSRYVNFKDVTNSAFSLFIFTDHQAFENF